MDAASAGKEDALVPSLLRRVADLPSRLLLSMVSAGVIAGLALAAGSVWLWAAIDRTRRR